LKARDEVPSKRLVANSLKHPPDDSIALYCVWCVRQDKIMARQDKTRQDKTNARQDNAFRAGI
jgi:hypothetical protein